MLKNKNLHVKIGDTVKVISGFNKNKTGEIIKIYKNTGKRRGCFKTTAKFRTFTKANRKLRGKQC